VTVEPAVLGATPFEQLFEGAPEAIVLVDARGCVLRANGEFTRMFGYTEAEARGRSLDDLIVPPERIAEAQHPSFTAESGRRVIEVTMRRRKDGSAVPVSVLCTPVTLEGGAPGVYSIYRDISERRRAEEEQRQSAEQLRELANRLQAVREEERRRIAIEIHDELGQALTGFKLQLAWLETRLPEGSRSLRGTVRQMLGQIDRTIGSVQRIGAELRPAVLDTLGPLAAIEWQGEEFTRRTGIPCAVTVPDRWPQVEEARSTALFRILQEALTNVARHAQAASVQVTVTVEDGWLVLAVEDDGKGVADRQSTGPMSLGLVGMRERVAAFGGRLRLAPRDPSGTILEARMPARPSVDRVPV
jgi:PAS domain S-box-containing protein